MKKPAVFFDRDNTLIVSDGYLGDPEQVKLMNGAADAVARARLMGFAIVTFSNQSGVARGMFTEDAVSAVNERMEEKLQSIDPRAIIDRHEFCPFHPEATVEKYRQDSELRKPKPGMLLNAAKTMDLDLASSWVIGDSGRDIEAGHAAGCRTILLIDPKINPSPAALEPSRVEPDETVRSLTEALDVIEAAEAAEAALAPGRPDSQANATMTHRNPTDAVEPKHFSLTRLSAGIVQVLAIFMAAVATDHANLAGTATILYAIFLQLLVIALLLMGRE
ncbi:MAG: HAD family hydrolase [Tepidisphaeraceae bacterium]|jgi:D-glycero-D-manno-heptose 1,7-bisphosphate phosphatase